MVYELPLDLKQTHYIKFIAFPCLNYPARKFPDRAAGIISPSFRTTPHGGPLIRCLKHSLPSGDYSPLGFRTVILEPTLVEDTIEGN